MQQASHNDMRGLYLAALLLLLPSLAQAADLYVDKDSIGGTCSDAYTRAENTISTPFCTIERGDNQVEAGDTVYVRAGTYEVDVSLDKDGTSWSAPITWKAYPRRTTYIIGQSAVGAVLLWGDYLIFDGFDVTSVTTPAANGGKGIWARVDHAKIIDNYVHGIKHEAITTASTSYSIADVQILNNHVYQSQYGIRTNGTEHLVRGNTVERPYFFYLDTEQSDCDYVRFFGDNLAFINNRFIGAVDAEVHNATARDACTAVDDPYPCCTGVDTGCWGHLDGMQNYAGISTENVLIQGNVFELFDQGMETAYQDDSNWWIVRNNVFRDSLDAGSGYGMIIHGLQHIYVYNNVFYNLIYRGVYAVTSTAVPDYILIKNNIFHTLDRSYSYEAAASYSAADYNDRYNCTEVPLPSAGAHDITSDPLFYNLSGDDYILQSNSPAIDAGSWLTTISSATGSGTSFDVGDAGYFWDGNGVTDGDVIRFQGGGTRTITDITGNTITVDSSVSWTLGDGIAPDFHGAMPDMGAYEYTPGNLMGVTVLGVTVQ